MTDMDIAGDFGICNDMDAAGSMIIRETGTRGSWMKIYHETSMV